MATPKYQMHLCPAHGEVLAVKNAPSHLFHLVMTVLTFGLWVFVWLFAGTDRIGARNAGTS